MSLFNHIPTVQEVKAKAGVALCLLYPAPYTRVDSHAHKESRRVGPWPTVLT